MKANGWARTLIGDFLAMCLCGVLFALSVNCFTAPNHIAPGGATGLATLMYDLWGLPIGAGVLCVNAPLFVIAALCTKRSYLSKTVAATIITSALIDALAFLPAYTEDVLLAAIFGGVLSGMGLAAVLSRSVATGGSDMAAQLIKLKLPALRTGSAVFAVDGLIVLLAGFTYRNISSTLYDAITIFVTSYVIDAILSGLDDTRMVYIISEKSTAIAQAITQRLERGATLLEGEGAYRAAPRKIVLCVVRPLEVHRLNVLVHEQDPQAFVILAKAAEVFGDGFKREESIRREQKERREKAGKK